MHFVICVSCHSIVPDPCVSSHQAGESNATYFARRSSKHVSWRKQVSDCDFADWLWRKYDILRIAQTAPPLWMSSQIRRRICDFTSGHNVLTELGQVVGCMPRADGVVKRDVIRSTGRG